WNAMAMVHRQNKKDPGIGGHISTYSSLATMLEVGYNHFFHATHGDEPGDFVYFQGHASPGVYARGYLEGRISQQQVENYRHELRDTPGLSSYPHPWLMPRVRIRRQSGRVTQFVTIIFYLLLADAAFQIAARINTGRGVALEINKIAGLVAVCGMEEMVIANLQHRSQRRVGGNVSANAGIFFVLPMDHGHGVPTDQALDAAFHGAITGIRHLFSHRNRIHVGGIQLYWDVHAILASATGKGVQQTGTLARAFLVNHFIKSFNPL